MKPKHPYLPIEGDEKAVIDVLNGMGISVTLHIDYKARSVRIVATAGQENSSTWREQEMTIETIEAEEEIKAPKKRRSVADQENRTNKKGRE